MSRPDPLEMLRGFMNIGRAMDDTRRATIAARAPTAPTEIIEMEEVAPDTWAPMRARRHAANRKHPLGEVFAAITEVERKHRER